MNKLFRILVLHAAPQDKHISIQTYLIANDAEHVYDWIKSQPIEGIYVDWEEKESEGDVYDVYDDDFNVIGTETFKERMIRLGGEMFDDTFDFSVAYEGITLYGWEMLCTISNPQIAILLELGIAHKT